MTKQITLRLPPIVDDALNALAKERGLEPADFAADLVAEALNETIIKLDQKGEAIRLQAERELKGIVAKLIHHDMAAPGFNPSHITLRVFQAIRSNTKYHEVYLRATGSKTGFERGNAKKDRINRIIGIMGKNLTGAATPTGKPRVFVGGEFCFSYQLFEEAA